MWDSYQERTNQASKEDIIDGIIYRVESETDYDVLNSSPYQLELINRFGDDDETKSINIAGLNASQVVNKINNL